VNSEVLNLKYVIILGIFSLTSLQPKYVSPAGIPGGVDASGEGEAAMVGFKSVL